MKGYQRSDYNFPEMPLNDWADVDVKDLVRKYKDNARRKLARAVRLGRVEPTACQECGDFKAEAHHPDYRYPLYVIWLCKIHHMALHKEAWGARRKLKTGAKNKRPIVAILSGLYAGDK